MKIYYGNENTDKEKFIFENIDIDRKTIIIVPDQFSLQMEQDALAFYTENEGRTALFHLMVTDFSSLGNKVVKEAGGRKPELIDKYGRHMLLSTIINKIDNLGIYSKMKGRNSFTSMMNQLISEMKRYGVNPSNIDSLISGDYLKNSYLKYKLEDIDKIYKEYERAIEGKYLDAEDYVRFYGKLIGNSNLVYGADVWIYGFDTFSPINMEIIQHIAKAADQLNIVMNYEGNSHKPQDARVVCTGGGEDIFILTGTVINNLKEIAIGIDDGFATAEIKDNRRENVWLPEPHGLVASCSSNVYEEAETAAAYIMKLIREENYKFRDIVLLCNDMNVRGRILSRTLGRWGIPVFLDSKRSMLHQPVVSFIVPLLEIVAKGYDTNSIMSLCKSGLMGITQEEESLLQNYTSEFRIRGSRWKKEFTLKGDSWTEEQLDNLNAVRMMIVNAVESTKDEIGRRNSAEDKVRGLYTALEQNFKMRDRVQELVAKQQKLDLLEGAAETAQSWNVICSLFEQLITVLGNEKISNDELKNIIEAGLETMEIGLVPQSTDCVIIGTMQRTRISRAKAVLVVGANEGVLPREEGAPRLLTNREMDVLEELSLRLSKREEVSRGEEQLAIYRMLSIAEDKLFMSCSLSDESGNKIIPSAIYRSFEKIAGGNTEIEITEGGKGCISYMAEAMRKYIDGGQISPEWMEAIKWFALSDSDQFLKICRGMTFSNKVERLEKDVAEAIFCRDDGKLQMSASSLEKYSGCPFAYFLSYGLKAQEQRLFEIGGREIGNIYHDCLMRISQRLTESDEWSTISKDECSTMIKFILASEKNASNGESAFGQDKEGDFRLSRIAEICTDVAWDMITQVRAGKIKDMKFEKEFRIDLGPDVGGIIRGKIDRMDILNTDSEDDALRIIDYKTGNVSLDLDHINSGYKLQLMLYMNGAKALNVNSQPAGVFYFNISESEFDYDKLGKKKEEALAKKIRKAYMLQGIVVNDLETMEAMDADYMDSDILPVKYVKKDSCMSSAAGGILMEKEDFENLCQVTTDNVIKFCQEIRSGNIEIAPKREKKSSVGGKTMTSCTYCMYSSICMFDTSFPGCKYTDV